MSEQIIEIIEEITPEHVTLVLIEIEKRGGHHGHRHPHLVTVTVDGEAKQVHPGRYIVSVFGANLVYSNAMPFRSEIERARLIAKLRDRPKQATHGRGGMSLTWDLRHRALASARDVSQKLLDGVPQSFDLSQYVKGVYDQDGENSCAAYSTAGVQSIFECIDSGKWLQFDAEEAYTYCGGGGDNPVSSTCVLSWDENTGFEDPATQKRYRISDYAMVYPLDDDGINTVKAAIAVKRPCVLAFYPPYDFDLQYPAYGNNGDCTSNDPAGGLHQACVYGYDDQRFKILNSYGGEWGTNGTGSILWSFLTSNEIEQSEAYVYTAIDANDAGLVSLFMHEYREYQRTRAHTKREESGPRAAKKHLNKPE